LVKFLKMLEKFSVRVQVGICSQGSIHCEIVVLLKLIRGTYLRRCVFELKEGNTEKRKVAPR